ncbi:MAG: hypothetical protein GY754_30505 [bacterium]|nr:hypothetical protein [bacterium]
MKTIIKKSILILLLFLAVSSAAEAKLTTPPSPYFVHDMEVFFFEFYDRMMLTRTPSKIGMTAILTAQQYLCGLIVEVPVYEISRDNKFSLMGGYAFQASGDGKSNNDFLANNNIAATHVAAASWYWKKHYVRLGYIYGAFTLDDDGKHYVNGVETDYDNSTGSRYFNYGTRELTSSTGFKRLYQDPDITYHRMLVETDWDLGVLVLKALLVFNFMDAPPFTRTGLEFNFFNKTYLVTPYLCTTNDVEGIEEFNIYQFGVHQSLKSEKMAQGSSGSSSIFQLENLPKLWNVLLDVNYTRVPATSVGDDRHDFYIDLELRLSILYAASWWNNHAGFGVGGGVNIDMDDDMKMWFGLKYNSFIRTPIYKRSINDKGYSFEWGCIASFN